MFVGTGYGSILIAAGFKKHVASVEDSSQGENYITITLNVLATQNYIIYFVPFNRLLAFK